MSAPHDLLDDYQVPESGPLYIIGSYDRRVTFYSQQVRAHNLVDALEPLLAALESRSHRTVKAATTALGAIAVGSGPGTCNG